jgi:very-long-chain ceramide synthase
MCVWGYLRHYINLRILYSIWTEFSTVGPFELNWDTQQYKCWISQYITFALLAALQAVNLIWWFYICRIAYRFVVLNVAEDERSEYEESEDEGEKEEKSKKTNGTNGVIGAPKVLFNGEEPSEALNGARNGSIASSVRDRKTKK